MKISADQKAANRRALLKAAVDVITDKGFRAASMRAMAREAGVGDATIYNYFPTKESILYSYYLEAVDSAASALGAEADFEGFDLGEKVQALFETILEGFLEDREFVGATFSSVFFHPLPAGKGARAVRVRFLEVLDGLFDEAVESGELPDVALKELVFHFIWDFFIAVVLYWLRDDSEQFANTSVLIDRSVDIGYAALKSGLLDKVTGLASFLFKSHVLGRMDAFGERRDMFERMKREFLDHG